MYSLGLDIGSSSVKAALVELNSGKSIIVVQEPQEEMEIISTKSIYAEQDPEIWWKHTCKAIQRIIKESNVEPKNILKIGIAYQMHGLVIVDTDGQPLRNAIIWCDSRAVTIGKEAYEKLGETYCTTHLLNSPGNFTASKLKWVKEHEPDIYNMIYKYMLPGDYIAFKLTGEICSTINGLSEGILWDYKENQLAHRLLDHYGIDASLTPEITENFTNQGFVNPEASSQTGLPITAEVTYRAGDQPNNALCLGALQPGQAALTGGTSGVVYAVTDAISFSECEKVNQFAHINYSKGNKIIGRLLNINAVGILYRWLLNNTDAITYNEMNELANKVAIGSDGLLVIPFGNGAERMLDNQILGAHIHNLEFNRHHKGHLYRAALEGIAFAFAYGISLLQNDNTPSTVLRAGNDNLFRSSIFGSTLATLINQKIDIYDTTGAIGAARATTFQVGDASKLEEQLLKNDYVKTYEPLHESTALKLAYKKWVTQLNITLKNNHYENPS